MIKSMLMSAVRSKPPNPCATQGEGNSIKKQTKGRKEGRASEKTGSSERLESGAHTNASGLY